MTYTQNIRRVFNFNLRLLLAKTISARGENQ